MSLDITPGYWYAKILNDPEAIRFMVQVDERQRAWVDGDWFRFQELEFIAPVPDPVTVDILRMRKSDRTTDYFVRLTCGDKNVTPHVFNERWKAEYEVAHYQWVFGLRPEEPSFRDYNEEAYPND